MFAVVGKLKLGRLFYIELKRNPKKSSKETKSILHSNRQNVLLIDLLMDTQILIDISYDSMHISYQQCCHADWDCNSLIEQ